MRHIRHRWLALVFLPALLMTISWLGSPQPASAACSQVLPTDKGQASYSFSVATAGTYRVWARLYPTMANSNGVYAQIDSTLCKAVIGHNNAIPANQLTWVDYGNTSTSKVNVALTAGSHQLTLAGYDASVGIDKVLLLADAACTPTGDGGNCTAAVTQTPTPPVGGGTTPTPSTSPVGSTPSPTPVVVGSSIAPVAVSGVIKLSPSSATHPVTYKLDGKPVSGTKLDTTKLSDGTHVIEEVTVNPDGTLTTKKQAIKVENGWQYQVIRFVKDHPVLIMLGVILIGLLVTGLWGVFGPRPFLRTLWIKYISRPTESLSELPSSPSKVHPTMAPQTVYPEAPQGPGPLPPPAA